MGLPLDFCRPVRIVSMLERELGSVTCPWQWDRLGAPAGHVYVREHPGVLCAAKKSVGENALCDV